MMHDSKTLCPQIAMDALGVQRGLAQLDELCMYLLGKDAKAGQSESTLQQ